MTQNIDFWKLLPSVNRNDTSKSFARIWNQFVSSEDSISVNGKVGASTSGSKISQPDADHLFNAFIPTLYAKYGTEEQIFTFPMVVDRLKQLGVDMSTLNLWMRETMYTMQMPIDYDKFCNYSQYVWVGGVKSDYLAWPAADWNPDNVPEYVVQARLPSDPDLSSYENDWQKFNYWIHSSQLSDYGISAADVTFAARPIIEYDALMKLNTAFNSTGPADTGSTHVQRKTKVGQYPLFDLYHYDGTHSGIVSPIFWFKEDKSASYDAVLQRHVAFDSSGLLFETGLVDSRGSHLFFKRTNLNAIMGQPSTEAPALHGYWTKSAATPSASIRGGVQLTVTDISDLVDNEVWTVTQLSSSQYTVTGERSGLVGHGTYGTPSEFPHFTLELAAGGCTFQTINTYAPRFVTDMNGVPVNAPFSTDVDSTYLCTERMFSNLTREARTSMSYTMLFQHFSDVIAKQDGLIGDSNGNNNTYLAGIDRSIGGTIREFDGNFQLLLSTLFNDEWSPLTLLDFAEQQMNKAYNDFDAFLADGMAQSIADGVASFASPGSIIAAFESQRASTLNLKTVYGDTTSGVACWPASLAHLGFVARVQPGRVYNDDLEMNMIVHHDGHQTPTLEFDTAMATTLLGATVTVAGEQVALGKVTISAPSAPGDFEYQLHYNKSTFTLYQYVNGRWHGFSNLKEIRNEALLYLEQKLYAGVKVEPTVIPDDFSRTAELEFATFCMRYKIDPYTTPYDATDSFTWNYSSANFGYSTGARWTKIYRDYFKSTVGLSFNRPDIEPWKLMKHATKPSDWDTKYASTTTPAHMSPSLASTTASAVETAARVRAGLQNVDGVQLITGDRIIYIGGSDTALHGLYTVRPGAWERLAVIGVDAVIKVLDGNTYSNSYWGLTARGVKSDGSLDTNDYGTLVQYRRWKQAMWADIKAANPGVKLCVNTATDMLIPPYVAASRSFANEALLNVIPAGTNSPSTYSFGDETQTELYWRKSLEHLYGAARDALKINPLNFLHQHWGFSYVQPIGGGLPIDRLTLASLDHTSFKLHGEVVTRPAIDTRVTNTFTTNSVTIVANGLNVSASGNVLNEYGSPLQNGDTFEKIDGVWTIRPASSSIQHGLGQTFVNFIRYNDHDQYSSKTIELFRGWDVKLGYRFNSLIRNDTLEILDTKGNIPETAYELVLVRSPKVSSAWFSALRIQLVEMGSRVLSSSGMYVPKMDASDWVFRVEGYNEFNPSIEVFTPLDHGVTFSILGGIHTPLHFLRKAPSTEVSTVVLPTVIVGLQNVLDLVFGYVDHQESLGFRLGGDEFPLTDAETGRSIDWQLEVEKFVNSLYAGTEAGAASVLNPSMNRLVFQTPRGMLGHFKEDIFADPASSQIAFDALSSAISLNNLYVFRSDNQSAINSDVPIFSARLFVDTYEHVLLLNPKYLNDDTSTTVFDQFSAARLTSAHMSYVRNRESSGKPVYPGFFISGNKMLRNAASSIDQIGQYYSANQTFVADATSRHALAMLGHSGSEDFFRNIVADDTTQFNFWRGMIQGKGTVGAIDTFSSIQEIESSGVDEIWAFKVAEYGDSRMNVNPELNINVSDVSRHTQLQFFSATDESYTRLPGFTQVESTDDVRWHDITDLGAELEFSADNSNITTETIDISGVATMPTYVVTSNHFEVSDLTIIDGADGYQVRTNVFCLTAVYGVDVVITGRSWLNTSAQSPVKLIDYSTREVVKEIGLWHPAAGFYPYEALERVNIIQEIDPALYSNTMQTASNRNFAVTKPWASREVGRVWWNTADLDYVPYWDEVATPNAAARNNSWGKLADWSAIQLYEWTESSVPPSEYDALAISQEGDASLADTQKATGRVALQNYYQRTRVVTARPVAWSKGAASLTDALGSATNYDAVVQVSGNALFVNNYRLADLGIAEGKHFGAWDQARNVPVSELVILNNLQYRIDTQFAANSKIRVSVQSGNNIGAVIGEITLRAVTDQYGNKMLTLESSDGTSESVQLGDLVCDVGSFASKLVLSYTQFGLDIVVEPFSWDKEVKWTGVAEEEVTAVITADVIGAEIVSTVSSLAISEGIGFTTIIGHAAHAGPLGNDIVTIIGDEVVHTNIAFANSYGWRCWDVPTQSDLDSDLFYPNSKWTPILGDLVTLTATADLVAEIEGSNLILRSGIAIKRYVLTWTGWEKMTSSTSSTVSDGENFAALQFANEIDVSRFNMYIDGSLISPSKYTVTANTVILNSLVVEGATITGIQHRYTPSAAELAFDPDVEEDYTIQQQFKVDSDYTVISQRDLTGALIGSKYYFWTKNGATTKNGAASLAEAASILQYGPAQYMRFAGLKANGSYGAVVLVGLDQLVKKDDSFKIRFVRNFTLREDPREMDLKNVHAEWIMISPESDTRIPEALWKLVTATVVEADEDDNSLPSQLRSDYDYRHGTKTRYGMDEGQIFADPVMTRVTLFKTINNNMEIEGLEDLTVDAFSAINGRGTMQHLWEKATTSQINALFFAVLEDACVVNDHFSKLFKTSMFNVKISTTLKPASKATNERIF